MTPSRAALREPMLWLVLAIPLATVAGGFATLWLAERGSGDVVPDDVRRTAQAQVADLTPDLEAARRGLSARVAIDVASGTVRADLTAGADPGDTLVLKFVHGLRAADDLALPLVRGTDHWQGQLPPLADADWRLVLGDARGQWRLVGRLPRGSHSAQLLPAVSLP